METVVNHVKMCFEDIFRGFVQHNFLGWKYHVGDFRRDCATRCSKKTFEEYRKNIDGSLVLKELVTEQVRQVVGASRLLAAYYMEYRKMGKRFKFHLAKALYYIIDKRCRIPLDCVDNSEKGFERGKYLIFTPPATEVRFSQFLRYWGSHIHHHNTARGKVVLDRW